MLIDRWSIMKPAHFIIWFSFNVNFRFSIKWYSRAQKVIQHKYVKYTCSMETVQQNGRFTLFSCKFHSNVYSTLFVNKFTQRNGRISWPGELQILCWIHNSNLLNFIWAIMRRYPMFPFLKRFKFEKFLLLFSGVQMRKSLL